MQTTNVSYDTDTGILTLRLTTGEEFHITQPAHALAIKDRISVGGAITDTQRTWLEQYRVELRQSNRERLRDKLKTLRREMWRP